MSLSKEMISSWILVPDFCIVNIRNYNNIYILNIQPLQLCVGKVSYRDPILEYKFI